MEIICVFCGNKFSLPVEGVTLYQGATITIRPIKAPKPTADFIIRCPQCDQAFKLPCEVITDSKEDK